MVKTSKELRAEIQALEAEYNQVRAKELIVARTEILDIMANYGITVAELDQPKRTDKRMAPLDALYADGSKTWSGRGRTPIWLVGKDKEQYRVQKQA